jgi:hypothetical protein
VASSAASPNGDGVVDEADEADEAEWPSAAPPTLPAPTTTPGVARAGASSGRDEIGASSGRDEIGNGRDEIGNGRDEIGGSGNGAAHGDNCGGVGGENGTAHPDSSSSSSSAGGEGATARALTAEEERMIDAEVKPLMRRAMLMASDARDANELGLRSSSRDANELGLRSSSGEASDARDAARRA